MKFYETSLVEKELCGLVEFYMIGIAIKLLKDIKRFSDLELRKAIETVLNPKVKRDHLKRRDEETLNSMKEKLLSYEAEIANCNSYEELRKLIHRNKIKQIGSLSINDIAYTLSESLKFGSRSMCKIYIQAGSLKGAKQLSSIIKLNIYKDAQGDYIINKELPIMLKNMHPVLCEDFLCTYSSTFSLLEKLDNNTLYTLWKKEMINEIMTLNDNWYRRRKITLSHWKAIQSKIVNKYRFLYSV